MSPKDDLRTASHKVVDLCVSERETTAQQPIVNIMGSDDMLTVEEYAAPPRLPATIDDTLQHAKEIYNFRVRMDHPRFFGFIPAPASHYSWMGEMLNSAYNPHAGSWMQSSGPSTVEKTLITWMARDALGFPETAGGCFVSGGSMANLSGLMVARDQKLSFQDRVHATIYISEQTHSSMAKGLRILGFDDSQLRKVRCHGDFTIDVAALKETIREDKAAGKIPFLIVGNAGATNTGAIDPFPQLAQVAKNENLWLHVDGAYGASISLCSSKRHLLRGIELADSVSWDAHKWLFQTYGCGMILMRDRKHLLESFATGAEYMQDAVEGYLPNFWNYTPELTRPARAMKLWFTLQMTGLDAVDESISHSFALAETAEAALRELPDWEIVAPAQLAIVCFRYRPSSVPADRLDAINQGISQTVVKSNMAGLLTTRLGGKMVLRICSLHPDLTQEGMVQVIKGLDEVARAYVGNSGPVINGRL